MAQERRVLVRNERATPRRVWNVEGAVASSEGSVPSTPPSPLRPADPPILGVGVQDDQVSILISRKLRLSSAGSFRTRGEGIAEPAEPGRAVRPARTRTELCPCTRRH